MLEKRRDANKIMGILREQAVLGLRGGDFGGLPLGDQSGTVPALTVTNGLSNASNLPTKYASDQHLPERVLDAT